MKNEENLFRFNDRSSLERYISYLDFVLDRQTEIANEYNGDYLDFQRANNVAYRNERYKLSNMKINIRRKENTLSINWATYDKGNSRDKMKKGEKPRTSDIPLVKGKQYTSKRALKGKAKIWEIDKILELEDEFMNIRIAKEKIGKIRRLVWQLDEYLESCGFSLNDS